MRGVGSTASNGTRGDCDAAQQVTHADTHLEKAEDRLVVETPAAVQDSLRIHRPEGNRAADGDLPDGRLDRVREKGRLASQESPAVLGSHR